MQLLNALSLCMTLLKTKSVKRKVLDNLLLYNPISFRVSIWGLCLNYSLGNFLSFGGNNELLKNLLVADKCAVCNSPAFLIKWDNLQKN